ncbi:hypothetical protein F511_47181 [Dorcoceras hygrometricum]|uniref:Uncharacterized protein n=1 Tax=Dorcoceras hygrometricum TaxID=472368 RepID=A0A2Z6ZRM7_9LAMI|nr:hypothetical protein F511_47181 [Dorcoceras hygrometricum]
MIKDSSSWMLTMGKQKAAVVKEETSWEGNQLRKPAQRSDLLSMMNKLARGSSRAGKNRTRSAQEQIRREEENSSKKRPAQRKPEWR